MIEPNAAQIYIDSKQPACWYIGETILTLLVKKQKQISNLFKIIKNS